MDSTQFRDLAQGLGSLISSTAILAGGAWAYFKFGLQKEKEPRAEFDLDVDFIGVQGGKWIVEVSAHLANKGKVRHLMKNATLNIRYMTAEDPIIEGELGLFRQVAFPHAIGRRKVWWDSYIDPGLQFRNSYIAWVPDDAKFILVLCRFDYGKGQWPAQRAFKVPNPAYRTSEHTEGGHAANPAPTADGQGPR